MIGLAFLAAGLGWLALSWYLATKIPTWLGIKKFPWLLTGGLLVLLLVGPFIDHIIGMRQFEKLCETETSLHMAPSAANTKKAKGLFSRTTTLDGNLISIERDRRPIVDADTNEEIAWFYRFRTAGGRIGRLGMLGGEHTCAIDQPLHPHHADYLAFERQINLTR